MKVLVFAKNLQRPIVSLTNKTTDLKVQVHLKRSQSLILYIQVLLTSKIITIFVYTEKLIDCYFLDKKKTRKEIPTVMSGY